jgi:hypothetical protein
MSLKIKVCNETPKGGKTICATCSKALVVKGQNGEERIVCISGLFEPNGLVTFKVAECGGYIPFNVPSLYEMEQIAWKVEARKRGPSGFTVPDGEDKMEIIVKPPRDNGGIPDDTD